MTEELGTSRGADYGQFTASAQDLSATTGQTLETIIIPRGATRLFFEIKNVGSFAFDEFEIQRRSHGSGNWETLANVAGDFSSPQIPILEVQGAPVTLAAGSSTFIRMDVQAADAIRIRGSSSPPVTTYDLHYRIQ